MHAHLDSTAAIDHHYIVLSTTSLPRIASSLLLGLVIGLGVVSPDPGTMPTASAQVQRARGWLGVVMDDRAQPGKVMVTTVMRGSPAAQAGVQPGDRIARVGNVVAGRARDVSDRIGAARVGDSVKLDLVRGGKEQAVDVRLSPLPSNEQMLRMQHLGRAAPELTGLQSTAGAAGPTLESLKGQVVIVDFWAPWCVACRAAVKHLNDWHGRYGSRGLTVLGVAAEPAAEVAQGTRSFGIAYNSLVDESTSVQDNYLVRELPSLVVIDRSGVVREVATGYDPASFAALDTLLEQLLAEPVQTADRRATER